MPMYGPISVGDVYDNLPEVLNRLEPGISPTEVGMKLRGGAIKFVKDGLPSKDSPGKWSKWTDVHLLIIEHDNHTGALEGMEAYSADPYDGPDPDPLPGWGEASDDGDITDAEEGGGAIDEDTGVDEDDDASSSDGSDSTGDHEYNGASDCDDVVMVEADASPKPAAETLEAPAGSVVATHSHVVPRGGHHCRR